jgi:hypothetical protein
MPYTTIHREEDGTHSWAVATASCRLDDENDAVIQATVTLVRRSYGEDEIMADAASVLSTEIVEGTFRLEHLLAAVRSGMPDPSVEGAKPPALTTYRSQSAEMIAKCALASTYQFEYPAAPQEGATNANQPILGFDGWGIARSTNGDLTLALIQVKSTDENASPPRVAEELANECRRAPRDRSALCRALTVLARHLRGDPLQSDVLRMLEQLGDNRLPRMHVAPAIVRGTTQAAINDLQPVRIVAAEFIPATSRGIVVAIGVDLADFGRIVMQRARAAA